MISVQRVAEGEGSKYFILLEGQLAKCLLQESGLQVISDPAALLQRFGVLEGAAVFVKKHEAGESDYVEQFEAEGVLYKAEAGLTLFETLSRVLQLVPVEGVRELDPWFGSEWFQLQRTILSELQDWDQAKTLLLKLGMKNN